MKKMNFAVLIVMTICCAVMVGCSEDYSEGNRIIDPTPKPDPTPSDPTPTDTTSVDPYAWANIVAKELNIDEDRQVESKIIAQRNNGEKDSTILRYILGLELSAPDTVRLTQSGTEMTAYAGNLSFPGKDYQPTSWQNCDSAIVVTTTKGYKTQYYDVTWKTSHVNGWILFKGHMEPYKNSEETTTFSALSLYKDAYEVVRNDSVYLREEVKHDVKMSFKNRTFSFEKKVVVDHFLKMREKEEPKPAEPEKVNADDYLNGLARFISATKVYNTDTKLWGDAYLFEGSESYKIYVCWYTKDDTPKGTTSTEVSFSICPKSNDYNAVAYIRGNLYPGRISPTGKVWDIGCYINGSGEFQGYGDLQVDFTGIKNFTGNNTAYPSPYIAATPSERTVNGYKVISVTGKTSVHTSKVTIADSLLKK